MTAHVVQYSGGIGSWAATQRVIAEHGTDQLVLLVADTRAEDPDLWRFVRDSAAHIGVEPTVVADGRTPFEVFHDQRFLGEFQAGAVFGDPQTAAGTGLAQSACRSGGHGAVRGHRLVGGPPYAGHRQRLGAVDGAVPMCEPPYLSKQDMLDAARAVGLIPPRLYELGFSHNNCGGVCVRGGQKHWLHLLEVFPDRYAHAEAQEQQLRAELGDVAILRERRSSVSRPLPLTELRRRHRERCTVS